MEARKIKNIGVIKFINYEEFSNYDYCDRVYQYSKVLKRLLSQIRDYGECKVMIEEQIPLSTEMEKENDLIKAKGKIILKSTAKRLSFFSRDIYDERELNKSTDEDFLGYIIIKQNIIDNNPQSIIFESILKPKIGFNKSKFSHCHNTYEININNKIFKLVGTVFSESNNITNSCSHCTLKTILSLEKYDVIVEDSEVNEILKKLLKKDLVKEDLTYLKYKEIFTVLKNMGLKAFYGTKKKYFQKYLYSSVESGYVGLLGFSTEHGDEDHIIPVIGHCFEKDSWIPNADEGYFTFKDSDKKYIPSDSWTSGFIINDDNLGSNYVLPLNYLDLDRISLFAGTIKKEIEIDPVSAEPIAFFCITSIIEKFLNDIEDYFTGDLKWLKRFMFYQKMEQIVLRTILISKEEYINHLLNLKDRSNNKIILTKNTKKMLDKILPDVFWMVEISLSDLYAFNNCKLGEILLLTDKELNIEEIAENRKISMQEALECFLLLRFPKGMIVKIDEFFNLVDLNIDSYTQIYMQD